MDLSTLRSKKRQKQPTIMDQIDAQIAADKNPQHSLRLVAKLHHLIMADGVITRNEDRMAEMMRQCASKIGDAICATIESGKTWVTIEQISRFTNIKMSVT